MVVKVEMGRRVSPRGLWRYGKSGFFHNIPSRVFQQGVFFRFGFLVIDLFVVQSPASMGDGRAAVKVSLRAAVAGVLAAGLTFANTAAAQLACRSWNTKAFFKAATVADVSRCLEAGANLEARDGDGYAPLHKAAEFGKSSAVVKTLLAAGANPRAQAEGNLTPLHVAAGFSHHPDVATVTALLNAGADIEARTAVNGDTPLHLAALNSGFPAVVKALLKAGANPRARSSDGHTAWDYAQWNGALKGTDAYWLLR